MSTARGLSLPLRRSRRLFARKTLATSVQGRPLCSYTYDDFVDADFAERVARLAGGLAALGVRRGDSVGTFAWNTHHHLEAVPKTSVGKFDKKVLRERFKDW